MVIRLNVIDREGKKTAIDIEEGTTIRDAIEEKLSSYHWKIRSNCGFWMVYSKRQDWVAVLVVNPYILLNRFSKSSYGLYQLGLVISNFW